MNRRICRAAVIVAVLMTFAVCASFANAATEGSAVKSGKCGDNVSYILDSMGTLTISGSGKIYDYDGYGWETGENMFGKRDEDASEEANADFFLKDNVKKLVIGEGITGIGENAFDKWINLEDVTFPSSLKSIGTDAFYSCDKLRKISLPESLEKIGWDAFAYCESLKNIEMGKAVPFMVETPFNGCCNLATITIDKSNTKYSMIKDKFLCYKLSNDKQVCMLVMPGIEGTLKIPESVSYLRDRCDFLSDEEEITSLVFSGNFEWLNCEYIHFPNLKSINVENPQQEGYYSEDGVLFYSSTAGKIVDMADKYNEEWDECSSYVDINEIFGLRWEVDCFGSDEKINALMLYPPKKSGPSYTVPEKANLIHIGAFWRRLSDVYVHADVEMPIELGEGVFHGDYESDDYNQVIKVHGDKDTPIAYYVDEMEEEENLIWVSNNGYDYKDVDEVPIETEIQDGQIKLFEDGEGDLGNEPIAKIFPGKYSLKIPLINADLSHENMGDGTFKVMVAIGLDSTDGNIFSHKRWESFTNNLNQALKNGSDALAVLKKQKSKRNYFESAGKFSPKVEFQGYWEGILDQNGNLISDSGGGILLVEGKYVWTQQAFTAPIPIPYYVELGAGAKAVGKMGIGGIVGKDNKMTLSGTVIADIPTIVAGAGGGVKDLASLGVEGDFDLEIQLYPPSKGDAKAAVSVVLTALTAEYKYELGEATYHLWDKTKSKKSASGNVSTASVSTIDRSFQTMTTSWDGEAVCNEDEDDVGKLQGYILPSAIPVMTEVDGRRVLVFQTNDEERADADCTKLVYSVYDDGEWSEPAAVYDNGAADSMADLKIIGGELYACWQKCKSKVSSVTAEDVASELAKKSEICVSRFDSETGKFTDSTFVTDNGAADMSPVMVNKKGTPAIVWAQNSENSLFTEKGENTYLVSELSNNKWTAGTRLCSSATYLSSLDAYYDGNDFRVITAVTDRNDLTESCVMLSENGNLNELVDNSDASVSGIVYEDGAIRYSKEGIVYKYDISDKTTSKIESGETEAISANALEFDNGDKKAVVWMSNTDEGCVIYSSVKCSGSYSEPVELYKNNKLKGNSFTALLKDDGTWQIILNASSETNSDNAGLYYIECGGKPKLELEDIMLEESTDSSDDSTHVVSYVVRNNSEETITSYDLTVETEWDTQIDETVECSILPGEEKYIEKKLTIDEESSGEDMTVTAVADGQTDLSKTSDSREVNLTNLELDVTKNVIDDRLKFAAIVSNSGMTETQGKVTLYADAAKTREIETIDTEELEPGQSEVVRFEIESEDISLTQDDTAEFAIVVEADSEESTLMDNEYFGVLYRDEMPDSRFASDKNSLSDDSKVKISGITAKTYTGSEITQKITVKFDGELLEENEDYTLEYENNIDVGNAIICVIGKGNYTGKATRQFAINAAEIASITLSETTYAYDGEEKTPDVKAYSSNGKELETDTDYEISWPAGRIAPGSYTISVTGRGNYTGTLTKVFTIKCAHEHKKTEAYDPSGYLHNGVEVISCEDCGQTIVNRILPGYSKLYVKSFKLSKGSKCFTAKWKKQSKSTQKKFTGYRIRYSRSSSMAGAKTVYVKKSASSKKISKLSKKKKYYVEIRSYVKKNGSTFYSKPVKKSVVTK